MFNDSFYPTPDDLIDKMLFPYLVEYADIRYFKGGTARRILEPSAGKGNIVDRLVDVYRVQKRLVSTCEIEPELRMILVEKGYKVIDSDFLEYGDSHYFNFIIMNPPFSNGEDHLLKAWEILHDGDLVCVLNAETVRNPYSKKRQLIVNLIEDHGSYEIVEGAFEEAERETKVDVVIIWLQKERKGFEFKGEYEKDIYTDEEYNENPLASANMVDSLVAQYNKARSIIIEIHEKKKQLNFYIKDIERKTEKSEPEDVNEQLEQLKKWFWDYLFTKTRIGQQTTSSYRKDWERFRESSTNLAFSKTNILYVFGDYFQNHDEIMKECIWKTFITATEYHDKNKVWVEGWKTNKSYRINRKIIIPNGIGYEWNEKFRVSHYGNKSEFFSDLDKVMCYLSRIKFEAIETIEQAINNRGDEVYKGADYRESFCSTFFEIKFFKKGTVHLTFLDERLLVEFNQQAALGKNWVGGGY